MAEREPGFYWVKVSGEWMPGRWRHYSTDVVATGGAWSLFSEGDDEWPYGDNDLDAIGPRLTPPA